jgi:acyl phosphate:glycerol-3-phosphate acyltransferase
MAMIGIGLVALLLAYLLGSIPFGIIFARLVHGPDPRSAGSQNIGFTNVLRVVGKGAAAATLVSDAAKGFVAIKGGQYIELPASWIFMAGVAAVLGHVFPIFLKFRGGKGVATGFGVLGAVEPRALVLTGLLWIGTFLISRYVSLASVVAFGLLPLTMSYFQTGKFAAVFSIILAFLILIRHKDNLVRLWKGTEHRL